jgi:hypothetical protein
MFYGPNNKGDSMKKAVTFRKLVRAVEGFSYEYLEFNVKNQTVKVRRSHKDKTTLRVGDRNLQHEVVYEVNGKVVEQPTNVDFAGFVKLLSKTFGK